MRTGTTSEPDDYLLPTPPPAVPKPIPQMTTIPVMETMLMQLVNVMSPDEILRVYAARKKFMAAATAAVRGLGGIAHLGRRDKLPYPCWEHCYGFGLGGYARVV